MLYLVLVSDNNSNTPRTLLLQFYDGSPSKSPVHSRLGEEEVTN